jgi:sulfite reductase (ferredoxin)
VSVPLPPDLPSGLPEDLPAPRRAGRPGMGQWGLGETDPVNPNEVFKRDDDGLAVRRRVEEVFSKEGFASIPADDLRGRLRWWGLYTQRKEGIDGGMTSTLEPEELDAEFFMLRVRIPGGALSSEQLRVVAGVATDFGRDVADLTDRQNVQYHWIRIEDVPEIWRRLESVGLSTVEACGDTPRNILGSPLAGVSSHELFDATPTLLDIDARWAGDPSFSNLPRKFKTAVTSDTQHSTAHEINDISLVAVRHDVTGELGYDLWVGGGLSTAPHLAVRLGTFVSIERAPEVWEAVIRLFRDFGYRKSRTRARLKFLVQDWGPERVRAVLEKVYLGYALPDGPPPAPPRAGRRDHIGVTEQLDGRFALGASARSGRTSGSRLSTVAELADDVSGGAGRVRITAEQKLLVLDVPAERVEEAVERLAELDLLVRPGEMRRNTMACTGIEFCKLALVNTKDTANAMADEVDRLLPLLSEPVRVNVNGCPNSCARFQIADIGFKGMRVITSDGRKVDGFQVHLGGSLAVDAALGRKVRGLRVTGEDLPGYVAGLVQRWQDKRDPGQSFAAWARTADEQLLTEGSSVLAGADED